MESDYLSEDAHVNKQEAYEDECVIEDLVRLLVVSSLGLTEHTFRNDYHLVAVKQK